MGYIPKKMVNTGLYAIEGQFVDSANGKPYTGDYHELFNGQVFSGKDPYDPNKRRLSVNPINDPPKTQLVPSAENLKYESLNSKNQELYKFGRDPEPFMPTPTGQDYKRGQILRYFAKKKNQNPIQIIEISKEVYDDILSRSGRYNYALWSVTKVFWKITGPLRDSKDKYGVLKAGIVDTNERLREFVNQEMRGLKSYLSNLVQFSILPNITLIVNQYTSGNEFTVKQDNSDYIGYYHIMADGTIMDGADMSQTTNKTLLAGNVLVQNRINTLIKEELGKLGAA